MIKCQPQLCRRRKGVFRILEHSPPAPLRYYFNEETYIVITPHTSTSILWKTRSRVLLTQLDYFKCNNNVEEFK